MLITSNARIGTKHPAYKMKKPEDPLQLQLQKNIHNINIIQRVGKGEPGKKGQEITEQETDEYFCVSPHNIDIDLKKDKFP